MAKIVNMFRLPDGIYQYSEREVNDIWMRWKKHIKACRYRCPLPQCDWKPEANGNEWQQVVEHFFGQHLTCPYCFQHRLDSTSFAAHIAMCDAKKSSVPVSDDDIPF